MTSKDNGKEVIVESEKLVDLHLQLMEVSKALLSISVPVGQAHMLTRPVGAIMKVAEALSEITNPTEKKSEKTPSGSG